MSGERAIGPPTAFESAVRSAIAGANLDRFARAKWVIDVDVARQVVERYRLSGAYA
jgi:hypothetical protein